MDVGVIFVVNNRLECSVVCEWCCSDVCECRVLRQPRIPVCDGQGLSGVHFIPAMMCDIHPAPIRCISCQVIGAWVYGVMWLVHCPQVWHFLHQLDNTQSCMFSTMRLSSNTHCTNQVHSCIHSCPSLDHVKVGNVLCSARTNRRTEPSSQWIVATKATLPLTIPRSIFKSSTSDSSPWLFVCHRHISASNTTISDCIRIG